MEDYKGWKIYERNGVFTVGGIDNSGFADCTLENLVPGTDEAKMVDWCRQNGISLIFNDLRGHKENVPYEAYVKHLSRYTNDPDAGFLSEELIVPSAIFSSSDQAKHFIDWLQITLDAELSGADKKISLDEQISRANVQSSEGHEYTAQKRTSNEQTL